MGKKKTLKEIESLKIQIENLKKEKSSIIKKQFDNDFENAISILQKYGNVRWEVERKIEEIGFLGIPVGTKYTLILDC